MKEKSTPMDILDIGLTKIVKKQSISRPGHFNTECKSTSCKHWQEAQLTIALKFKQNQNNTQNNSQLVQNPNTNSNNNLPKPISNSQTENTTINHHYVQKKQQNILLSNIITNIKIQTDAVVKSTYNNFEAKLSFLVIDKITEKIPQVSFDVSSLNIPSSIKLADPELNKASQNLTVK
ncbi:unnamed protein product [Brassicogethes aeneus]|uniref:Uncharacterized protein n=1 Tax=Brassicogethes aeneus TaxID=1431903 RepID=A0A9P0AV43_BRAAE|nr:unnamed protein product [Brassicogethes aeneus]